MNICVDGANFFHTGWLACFLGLPRKLPGAAALRASDVAAFEDGWDMCSETSSHGTPNTLDAFAGMVRLGQAHVCWVNDNNDEIAQE